MMLSILVMLAMPIAAELSVDFDQGKLEIAGIVQEAKKDASALKEAQPQTLSAKKVQFAGKWRKHTQGFSRWDRECVRFIFEPKDRESQPIWLRSTEYVEECRYDREGRRECWERPGFTNHVMVQIRIPQRKEPYPWENEHFAMCLDGYWVTYDELKTAFEYDAKFVDGTGIVVLNPKGKIPTSPDAEGIALDSFGLDPAASNFVMALKDKWASYYAGEQTVLKLTLKESAFWSDPVVFEGEVRFSPQDRTLVRFSDLAKQFKTALKDGSKYYVTWSFQRIGKISTDKSIKKGETGKVEFHKSTAISARK